MTAQQDAPANVEKPRRRARRPTEGQHDIVRVLKKQRELLIQKETVCVSRFIRKPYKHCWEYHRKDVIV